MSSVLIQEHIPFAFMRLLFQPFVHAADISACIPENIIFRSDKDYPAANILDFDLFLFPDRVQPFRLVKHLPCSRLIAALFRFFGDLLPVFRVTVRVGQIRQRLALPAYSRFAVSGALGSPVFSVTIKAFHNEIRRRHCDSKRDLRVV